MFERDFNRRRGSRGGGLLIGLVLLIPVLIGFIAFRMLHRPVPPVPAPRLAAGRAAPAAPAPAPAPTGVPLQGLPKLDVSDPFIRKLAQVLSANPEWGEWLLGERLVQRLTASIDNVAEGRSPKPHLGVPDSEGRVRLVSDATRRRSTPRSYRRYDLVADVVASLDAKGCARLYQEIRPLFHDAYRHLGYPDRDFDRRSRRRSGAARHARTERVRLRCAGREELEAQRIRRSKSLSPAAKAVCCAWVRRTSARSSRSFARSPRPAPLRVKRVDRARFLVSDRIAFCRDEMGRIRDRDDTRRVG